nr:Flp/Fap pilin component [uncultured bacterium]
MVAASLCPDRAAEVAKPQQKTEIYTMLKFLKDESGATAIEYGLIAALVAVACIVALEAMGTSLQGMFNAVKGKLDAKKPT